ncbi:MAG: hypothetical protein EA390_05615 [Balneolaceae bacterium]|nr:MAG: hypothetical protein EA390_05615 [Balneolaceae bacterium]
MNTCCGPDGCGFPEVEVVSEIEECTDCGDVPIPWSPPELEDPEVPWNPDDPGSGGEPCLDCEPGDDPNNDEETCPLGQIDDGFGNCIGEEGDCPIGQVKDADGNCIEGEVPCEGDDPPDYCSEPEPVLTRTTGAKWAAGSLKTVMGI